MCQKKRATKHGPREKSYCARGPIDHSGHTTKVRAVCHYRKIIYFLICNHPINHMCLSVHSLRKMPVEGRLLVAQRSDFIRDPALGLQLELEGRHMPEALRQAAGYGCACIALRRRWGGSGFPTRRDHRGANFTLQPEVTATRRAVCVLSSVVYNS